MSIAAPCSTNLGVFEAGREIVDDRTSLIDLERRDGRRKVTPKPITIEVNPRLGIGNGAGGEGPSGGGVQPPVDNADGAVHGRKGCAAPGDRLNRELPAIWILSIDRHWKSD